MSAIHYIWASALLCLAVGCDSEATANQAESSSRTPASEVAWGPTPFGPEAAAVEGDFSTGQHVTLIRFSDGLITPAHTHTHDYVGIVISGTTRHFLPNDPSTRIELPAGSHWFIPGGLPHVSECISGSECVMALIQKDAFDFLPTEGE